MNPLFVTIYTNASVLDRHRAQHRSSATWNGPIADLLWDFRIAGFGGAVMTQGEACALLRHAGYSEAMMLPTAPGAVAALVAGRR